MRADGKRKGRKNQEPTTERLSGRGGRDTDDIFVLKFSPMNFLQSDSFFSSCFYLYVIEKNRIKNKKIKKDLVEEADEAMTEKLLYVGVGKAATDIILSQWRECIFFSFLTKEGMDLILFSRFIYIYIYITKY